MYTLADLQQKHDIFAVQFPDNNLLQAYMQHLPRCVADYQRMTHGPTKHHDQVIFTQRVCWNCHIAETQRVPVYPHTEIKDFNMAIVFSAPNVDTEQTCKAKISIRFYVLLAIYLVGVLVASAMQSTIVAVSALGALVAASTEYISHEIDTK